MSDHEEEKTQVYLLDSEVHQQHLEMRDQINHHTGSEVSSPPGMISDLCEYYILSESFIRLLMDIKLVPPIPAEQEGKSDYVLDVERSQLFKFYLPLLVKLNARLLGYNLSLAYH